MNNILQNGRQQYFDFSKKVSFLVDEYIKNYLQTCAVPEKSEFYKPMLSRKFGAQKLRANIVCASYLFFSNSTEINIPEKVIKCAVIIEFSIWATYMVNWIYDEKSKVDDPAIKKRVAVAANSFLQDAMILASSEEKELFSIILAANDQQIKSFWAELDTLKITNDELANDYEKYIKVYDECYGGPGVGALFAAAIHLGYLCSGSREKNTLEKIKEIFYEFGINHETLNALSDFVITEGPVSHEKISSDQFSDIRNNTLTPPIWFMLNYDQDLKNLIRQGVGKRPNADYQQQILKGLFASGAFSKVSTQLKKMGRNLKNRFPKSTDNNVGNSLLKQIISVFESNEIYHYLNENNMELS
jgi:geranylgeranyl pyrophosphate synthase